MYITTEREKLAQLPKRDTIRNVKSNPVYWIHTTMGCWRGPAQSIVHALRLARKTGIKGHIELIDTFQP